MQTLGDPIVVLNNQVSTYANDRNPNPGAIRHDKYLYGNSYLGIYQLESIYYQS